MLTDSGGKPERTALAFFMPVVFCARPGSRGMSPNEMAQEVAISQILPLNLQGQKYIFECEIKILDASNYIYLVFQQLFFTILKILRIL